MPDTLKDSFGRRFSYLRLSLTEACNFRCGYCLPNGYKKTPGEKAPLSISEIENLVTAFAEMGTYKVRLTGGEPTLRPDLLEIAARLKDIPGIRKLALSTNGYRLKELAPRLPEAGITAVNVSVDTLDRERFQKVTGVDSLPEILDGIGVALKAGLDVKVNAVLLKDLNDDGFHAFLEWTKDIPVAVRFIELMPTGQTTAYFARHHLQSTVLATKLLAQGWTPRPRGDSDGPAQEFTHPNHRGRLGLIAPYASDFCASCNRLRVTSQGGLRLCLFGEGDSPLREWLQHADQRATLKAKVAELLQKKDVSHYLPEGRYGNNQTFSAMGG